MFIPNEFYDMVPFQDDRHTCTHCLNRLIKDHEFLVEKEKFRNNLNKLLNDYKKLSKNYVNNISKRFKDVNKPAVTKIFVTAGLFTSLKRFEILFT